VPGSAGPAAGTRPSLIIWPGCGPAEPHATAERLIELEREAAQATRQPAVYTDVTVSFSKSISVLHASIRENERRARLAGDQRAAAYWAGREQAFQEILHRANRAALEYLQAWAGVTRTGYHGTRIDGCEPGRFEPAGLIVTSWLQGTSRDGDPQDHIHNQIARITRTFSDGRWRNSCKLVLAGDQEQLAAVEGGGAMTLLADRLGYVQLAEPVRFTAAWERGASLRLRSGDATALNEYDQHGRIRGAPPDQAMDQAARAYVASYLAGRDVLLMAADWARCRELSARIRDDLIHLGLVDSHRTIRIADGAEASAGDLIICRRNDHRIEAGEPGRALANGDILRIETITPGHGITVRRLLGPDAATGQRRFTSQAFGYDGYQSAELAYAITGHSAQGATVHTGIAVVTGSEDRQWLYPAMTRGTDANLAFVFTTPARPADPAPGIRPALGLSRYERVRQERAGYLADYPFPGSLAGADKREPIAVLADVVGRDGTELSASAIRQRNLADADHLAILHAIWTAETQQARHDCYRDLVLAAVPPGYRQDLSHQARWLFRTLHAAELAGLDTADVLGTAIAARDLAGARDIAAVLDARIRPRVHPLFPQPQRPWARQVPQLPDRSRRAYLAEIAAMMDDRTRRLGQHTAQTGPAWAISTLGPIPADPTARRTWQARAGSIAAYREMYSYSHPNDPVGPEPSRETPDQRAAWHQAHAALGPGGGRGVRAMPDALSASAAVLGHVITAVEHFLDHVVWP
jgi:AAA domain/TrwC relaxase